MEEEKKEVKEEVKKDVKKETKTEPKVEVKTKKKMSAGAIVGIILAILFVVFLILGVIIAGVVICVVNGSKNQEQNSSYEFINNGSSKMRESAINELYEKAKKEEKSLYEDLEKEWKTLSTDVNTFEKYKNNTDKIKAFYEKIESKTKDFTVSLREYASKYAEEYAKNGNAEEVYDKLDTIYEDLYNEVASSLYDDIYDNLISEIYDYYYSGILSDAYNTVPYDDYSKTRSAEYKLYNEAKTEIYNAYTKARTDIYSLYSKLRSASYIKDSDKLKREIENYKSDINKLRTNNTDKTNSTTNTVNNTITNTVTNNTIDNTITNTITTNTINTNNTSIDDILPSGGISTEFKNAMDLYEKFINEYVEYLKRVKKGDLSAIAEYATMIQKYNDMEETFDNWNADNMTKEELAYYQQVIKRTTDKIAEAGQN